MQNPSYLIVSVATDDQDNPTRPLINIAEEILIASIEGIVSVRAAHNDHPLSLYVPVGPEYLGDDA